MTRSWFRRAIAERVRVHTRDGQSIDGFLRAVYRRELVLEHGKHVSAAGDVEIDGTVCVPRDNVAWIQQVPPAPPES